MSQIYAKQDTKDPIRLSELEDMLKNMAEFKYFRETIEDYKNQRVIEKEILKNSLDWVSLKLMIILVENIWMWF